jgi:hypothetical protein
MLYGGAFFIPLQCKILSNLVSKTCKLTSECQNENGQMVDKATEAKSWSQVEVQ